MVFDEGAYFGRRGRVHAAIDVWRRRHPENRWGFPVKYGLALARDDIEWWAHYVKDVKKRRAFVAAAKAVVEAGKPFKSGMDVPRGVEIERLYYKMIEGYSDAQYAEHLQSMD